MGTQMFVAELVQQDTWPHNRYLQHHLSNVNELLDPHSLDIVLHQDQCDPCSAGIEWCKQHLNKAEQLSKIEMQQIFALTQTSNIIYLSKQMRAAKTKKTVIQTSYIQLVLFLITVSMTLLDFKILICTQKNINIKAINFFFRICNHCFLKTQSFAFLQTIVFITGLGIAAIEF